MNDLEIATIESACTQLFGRYAIILDSRDWSRLGDVFADNASWHKAELQSLNGIAQIQEYFMAIDGERAGINPMGYLHRHLFTSISIQVLSSVQAIGKAYGVVFIQRGFDGSLPADMPPPEMIVDYHETFAKTAIGWRVVNHSVTHVFRSPSFKQPLSARAAKRLTSSIEPSTQGT